ncbi:MAG: OB-fold domain-containing protein [Patescibacteria group bacterium]|nr:OB-fold domain-containing protein [Patescibacteria group bacterium]
MKITPVKLWRRQKHVASLIGKTGILLQWTLIRVPAKTFAKEAPYPVAIVKMDNGEKMIGQLVDWQPADLEKGKKVIAVLRKFTPEDAESVIAYTIKFKPHEND